ncbi:MAG: NUDIX domain-containing protein [Alphaproteobacteria bacterium]
MVEYFDVLDDSGNLTGEAKPRDEVHANGLWHKAVHVWIVNDKDEILLQKRASCKESFPDMWDISAAGHLSAGDDTITGAIREIEEELGFLITAEELQYIGSQKVTQFVKEGFINNEFNDIFVLRRSLDLSKLVLQEEEVNEVKYIPLSTLKEMVANRDETLLMHDEGYKILFKALG